MRNGSTRYTLALATAALCSFMLLLSGCGSPAPNGTTACNPDGTCPSGGFCGPDKHCYSSGDMLVCAPGCSGATPVCDRSTLTCVACLANSDCRGAASTCCDHVCVDVTTDDKNCGACATACGAGGKCCTSACRAITSDAANCGACGTACTIAHGAPSCVQSVCAVASCDGHFADCNRNATDGCEIDTATDLANCGGCGKTCPTVAGTTWTCTNGACAIAACTGTFKDCDANPANGCEVNVTGDINNCGQCGAACMAYVHAVSVCNAGVCGMGPCDVGYTDCNMMPGDGCEASLNSDIRNCGTCGVACSKNHVAMPLCTGGTCGGMCDAGFADCNNNKQSDGCEVALAVDVNNCGACGTKCPAGDHCAMGMCRGICQDNANWTAVTCTDPSWDWSINRFVATTRPLANTHHVLATSNANGNDMCSLDGMGWVSTTNYTVTQCNTLFYHLGGTYTGNCGGHDGETYRLLALGSHDCYTYNCGAGTSDCDGNAANGCEVATGTDAMNCGACTAVCSNNHIAAPTCAGGVCNGACTAGWGDCNGSKLGDGCETDLTTVSNCGGCGRVVNTQTDSANCGRCGNACTAGYHCSAGVCHGSCYDNAAWSAVTCVDASWDWSLDRAFATTRAAANTNHALATSNGGGNDRCSVTGTGWYSNSEYTETLNQCNAEMYHLGGSYTGNCGGHNNEPYRLLVIGENDCYTTSCAAGTADCDGNPANACEVNTAGDAANCGHCHHVCPANNACVSGACAPKSSVYLTGSNGGTGFFKYDVLSNTWTILTDPPSTTHSQLTTNGSVVYLMGDNNIVYQYDPAAATWSVAMAAGPGAMTATPIGLFKWTPRGFFYAKDGTTSLNWYNGAAWTSFTLPASLSCAGTFDPATGYIYIRTYGNMGLLVWDTNNNTLHANWPNATVVGENSRTGSFSGGNFWVRGAATPLTKIDVTTGVATATAITPSESHTSSDVNLATGDIFFGPYSPTNKAFEVLRAGGASMTTLAPLPAAITNHSTIVYLPR